MMPAHFGLITPQKTIDLPPKRANHVLNVALVAFTGQLGKAILCPRPFIVTRHSPSTLRICYVSTMSSGPRRLLIC